VNNLEYELLESQNQFSGRLNLKNRFGTSQLVESFQQPINGNLSSHSKPDFSLKPWFFTNLLRATKLPPAGPDEGDSCPNRAREGDRLG